MSLMEPSVISYVGTKLSMLSMPKITETGDFVLSLANCIVSTAADDATKLCTTSYCCLSWLGWQSSASMLASLVILED